MDILIMIAIVFAALIIVGFPLVNSKRYRLAGDGALGVAQFDDLYNERDRLFDALRDLQAEHTTGKLSDSDFQMLTSRYESKTATILQQIDAVEQNQSKSGTSHKSKSKGAGTCPRCHARIEANDHFCFECGYKL